MPTFCRSEDPVPGHAARSIGLRVPLVSKQDSSIAFEQGVSFKSLCDKLPISLMILNAGGECIYVNQRWLELTKFDKVELMGNGWVDMILPMDREWLQEELGLSHEQGRELSTDFRLMRPDGEVIVVHGRAVYTETSSGALLYTTLMLEDTSHRARLEAELSRAAEMATAANVAKSDFLTNMSHEIRTPMNAVLGMTALLLDSSLTDEQRDFVGTIGRSGDALLAIINDIIDFSKVEAGKLVLDRLPFDLCQSIDDAVSLLRTTAHDSGLTLTGVHEVEDCWVFGDQGRLAQVLLNLISNAIKFTKTGGIALGLDVLGDADGRRQLTISVADTGIGIPEDKLELVFDQFTQADSSNTRETGGAGLGLAIARRIIELMDGTLSLSSEVGIGSTFTIHLDLEIAQPPTSSFGSGASNDLDTALFSDKQVLLVEDNAVNQKVARKILERLGYRVQVAIHGRDALLQLESYCPDVILMDCQMPIMDGFDCTRAIRKLDGPVSEIPIVALTANAMVKDRQRCEREGMNGFLLKPLRIKELIKTLASVLGMEIDEEADQEGGDP